MDPDGRLPANQLLINTRFSSGYGPREVAIGSKYHRAVDIYTLNAVRDIYAAANGVVSFSGSQRDANGNLTGYGNWVEIKHYKSDGKLYKTRYAHLKDPSSLKVGDKVAEGDVIGEMGNTGTSGGAHLHFEIFGFNFDLGKWFNIDPGNPKTGFKNVGDYNRLDDVKN